MLDLLVRHDKFKLMWNKDADPLLRKTNSGISVTTQQGRASVSHRDHLIGTLAECGVPLEHPIHSVDGTFQFNDLLNYAVQEFSLNQREYEWTALSLALFVADGNAWYTKEGQEIDFDLLADRIMRQRQPQGVCYGNHRLYTLAILLRINEQMHAQNDKLLSEKAVAKVENYLLKTTAKLMKSQSIAGYWDGNWPDKRMPIPDPNTNELSRRVLATGHALEWWAMAPKKLHPPRETIIRASQWLAKTIIEMDAKQIEKNYTFLTHAARALSLWRGGLAFENELLLASQSIERLETANTRQDLSSAEPLIDLTNANTR